MTDDRVLSPGVGDGSPFLHSQHLQHITMDGDSPNSEDLIEVDEEQEEDDEEMFEIVGNHQEGDSPREFGVEGDDHEDVSEQYLNVDDNIEEESEQVLELENQDHSTCSEQFLVVKGDNAEHTSLQVPGIGGSPGNNIERSTAASIDNQNSLCQEKYYPPPVVGMEFESYDDAYNYYNCHAKELGFAVRVKSSWTKRNSKEKRGAVLCCNCEGFKTFKEVAVRRKETRTGCQAMLRLRLVESNRWRVDEVKLDHNHLFDPVRAQNSKSHKKTGIGTKRMLEPTVNVEVRTIKLYRTPTDAANSRSCTSTQRDNFNHGDSNHLKLNAGDMQAIQNYFCQKQLTNPNFFYIMDLNDEGQLRNVFWIDPKSRAAYRYFGDVVAVDTSCLSDKYNTPLVVFVGINQHGQSILLGCAFIADETVETYVWLFRGWLTCMSGRPPQTIVTDRCKALQGAISDVFPRAQHRFLLPLIIRSILKNSGSLQESQAFQSALNRAIYGYLKIDEFEMCWDTLIHQFGLQDHEWFHTLYEERDKWAPAYLKETFLAGLFAAQATGEPLIPFFASHVHENTPAKEFFEIYDVIMQKKRQKEQLSDLESRDSNLLLRTRCYYELQLSRFYTKDIFEKFQVEVEMIPCCLSINQVHASGPVITYLVKERENGGIKEFQSFEVNYDKAATEIRCSCGGFYLKGYLCRHALSVLSHNGVEEIPLSYIHPRWRKDCKRVYVADAGSNIIDISNPTQWHGHLHRLAMQVVEEGVVSQDHYMVAWQAFLESLNKVRLTVDKHV